MNQYLSNTRHP